MSLFKNAEKIEAPAAKKGKKAEKPGVQMSGLQTLTEIDTLIKTLTALKGTYEEQVKKEAYDYFVEHADGKRPENFRGVEGNASASIELRKRSSASALSEAEVTLLKSHGIAAEKKIVTQQLFGINPKYASDDKLLDKVSKAISKFVPEDFIVVQEEKSAMIVSDEAIEKVFTLKPAVLHDIMGTVTTLAIKPKLEEVDIDEVIQNVWDIISPETEEA